MTYALYLYGVWYTYMAVGPDIGTDTEIKSDEMKMYLVI